MQVRDYATSRGVELYYLYREAAVRERAWECHRRDGGVVYVVGCGHGNEKTYTGYRLNKIYWVDMLGDGFDPSWVRNRVFLLLSCLTAAELGPYMVERLGVWSYVGWDREFVFWVRIGYRKMGESPSYPDWYFLKPVEEAMPSGEKPECFGELAAGLPEKQECATCPWKKYCRREE